MTADTYQVLSPSEYEALIASIPTGKHRIDHIMAFETMLNTGARYKELEWFADHPQAFNARERTIVLPAEATKTRRGRTIHLTPVFSKTLEVYLAGSRLRFPHRSNMIRKLRRLHGSAMAKSFRKTWETWLLLAGYDSAMVAASQGHTLQIQYSYYLNPTGKLKIEIDRIKEFTKGWMT